MSRGLLVGAAVIVLGLLSGCGHNSGATTVVPKDAQVVHVHATNFKWTLDKTTFQAGKPIDFVVQSDESVHGFSIVGTNLSQVIGQGDKPVNMVFTPDKPGQYTIKCNQYCGAGHDNMFLTFTVQ